jgi:hypothetical protein
MILQDHSTGNLASACLIVSIYVINKDLEGLSKSRNDHYFRSHHSPYVYVPGRASSRETEGELYPIQILLQNKQSEY